MPWVQAPIPQGCRIYMLGWSILEPDGSKIRFAFQGLVAASLIGKGFALWGLKHAQAS
jgi:hypothetical protein